MSTTSTNSTDECSKSLPSPTTSSDDLGSGQPMPYGIVHPTLQQVDSPVNDVASLREYLGEADPFMNWQKERMEITPLKLTSCFPHDEQVAFYTPGSEEGAYDALTYQSLHEQIMACPPFPSGQRVAIVIPVDQMADMAMTLLSVIAQGAVAVPLDPRMPTKRVLEAMEQLECTCLAATEDILTNGEMPLLDKADSSYTSSDVLQELGLELDEIRVVKGGVCGRISWTCLSKVDDDMWVPLEQQMVDRLVEAVAPSPSSIIEAFFGAAIFRDHPRANDKGGTGNEHTPPPGNSVAMLLRTSGTTNKPKVVPISHNQLLYGSLSIAAALKLTREDCNANSMPFYHIGGISCNLMAVLVSGGSVLLAGPLNDPNIFLDHLLQPKKAPMPTWYYAGPSMHKAIVLMAEARYNATGKNTLRSHLRFVRSAAAHLNHDLALHLSTVFGCQVIPTYGMSEAMPICSSAPIDVGNDPPCQVIDSVGHPAGTSVRIVDPETDEVLPYGSHEIGEICVRGAGVIPSYIGLDPTKTHSSDGWLRTGDHGLLDRQGRLFIKGRSKEMIKRGGEQVWPNEIDDVVEKVPGVATAVAFGVPNELWGEEVAVAVVLKDPTQKENSEYTQQLTNGILNTCQNSLDEMSMPQQIKFLSSTTELPRGSTGKYIRSKIASHLKVTAVDTGALRVLTSVSQLQQSTQAQNDLSLSPSDDDEAAGDWDWLWDLLETKSQDGRRAIPCDALNGVRFLVSCFVVHVHVGQFPNLTWIKLQGFVPNMMIFFSLAGFQTTCQVARSVKGQWANFVGTKIGALHSLFVISQIITFPSYVLFHAFNEEGDLVWDGADWAHVIIRFIFSTATGLGHNKDVNMFAWFQSTLYIFLVLFPFLDDYLRRQTLKRQGIFLIVFGILSAGLWGFLYLGVPSLFFLEHIYPFGWSIIAWLPLLLTSMLMSYMFLRLVEYYWQQEKEESTIADDTEMQTEKEEPDTIGVEQLEKHSKLWGKVCDACSVVFLLIWIGVAVWRNCLCVYGEKFEAMRPNDPMPEGGCHLHGGTEDYVDTCGITYDEFTEYIQYDPNHFELGRFVTNWSGAWGYMRIPSPLFALWIASMAFGQGYTARIFSSKVMTRLAPLGYPVYMMQMAVARYYWLATRGLERQEWWGREGEIPFPVEWYEFFLILLITIVVGGLINTLIVPMCMPHSISLGVRVCSWISGTVSRFTCCCSGVSDLEPTSEAEVETKAEERSTYSQVRSMVRGLTGVDVKPNMSLRMLGLDSLGAAALLGALRSSVPAARKLTLRQLQDCDTVGDLADFLEGTNRSSEATTAAGGGSASLEEIPIATPSVGIETPMVSG